MSVSPQTLLFTLRVQDEASRALQGAGLAWGTLGFAIGAAAAASVKAALDFNRSVTQMQTLAGVAASEIGQVTEALKDMAIETGRGPQDLANAMYYVSSSGFKTQEAMDVVRASAEGAAIGLGSTKTVADAVTSAMNAYGHENLSAADAVGTLVEAVKLGKGEADQIASAIGRVIGVSGHMGVSFKEVTGVVAALTTTGLTAAQGVTAVRQTLLAMQAPTMQASRTLKALGVDYHDLQNVFKEKGILEGMENLKRVAGTEFNLRRILGDKEAVNAIFSLLGSNFEHTKQIMAEMEKSGAPTLAEAFATAAKSSAFSWDQGMALIKVLMIDLGNAVMPIVINAIHLMIEAFQEVQGVIRTLTNAWNDHRAAILLTLGAITSFMLIRSLPGILMNIAGVLATATARMIAMKVAMEGVTVASAGAALGETAVAAGLVGEAAGAAAIGVRALTVALLSNPLTWWIAGIGAAVGILYALSGRSVEAGYSIDTMAKAAGEGGEHLRVMYDAAKNAVDAEDALARTSAASKGGLEAGAAGADTFAAALQRLGVTAQWSALQIARVAVIKASQATGTARDEYLSAQVAAASDPNRGTNLGSMTQGAEASARATLENRTRELRIWTKTLGMATGGLNQALAPVGRPSGTPLVDNPDNIQDVSNTRGGKKGGAGKESPEEKEATATNRVIESIKAQAAAYTQSADAKEYLDHLKQAGLQVDDQQYDTMQKAAALTDKQVAGDYHLANARRIAVEELKKLNAQQVKANIDNRMDIEAQAKLATAHALNARLAAISTAGVNAYTAAIHANKTEAEARADQARAEALEGSKFDSARAQQATDSARAFNDSINSIQDQTKAFDMDARSAAGFLAAQQATSEALRTGRSDLAAYVAQQRNLALANFDLQNHQLTASQGVIKFMDEAKKNAITTGSIIYNALGSVYQGLSSSLWNFVSGQKAGWRQMASDVVSSIGKMIVQMLVMKAVMASLKFLGFAMGGTPGTSGTGGTGGSYSTSALGNIFGTANKFAKGQSFTNTVVDALTAFVYHEDGRKKLGVMGEAGPEAIMPLLRQGQAMAVAAYARDGTRKALQLTRGPDGALGVKMPERYALGGTFGGGRQPTKMGSAGWGGGGGDQSYTHIDMGGVQVNYAPTGDPKYDAGHLQQLKQMVTGVIDERIGVAVKRIEKKGGRLSIFGMKESH